MREVAAALEDERQPDPEALALVANFRPEHIEQISRLHLQLADTLTAAAAVTHELHDLLVRNGLHGTRTMGDVLPGMTGRDRTRADDLILTIDALDLAAERIRATRIDGN